MTLSNYIDIILDGYMNHKEYLSEHFYREYKEAEKKHIGIAEFFKRLNEANAVFLNEIKQKYHERVNELELIKSIWESEGKPVKDLEDQKPEMWNYSVHLMSLTKGKYLGHFWITDIDYVQKAIVKAIEIFEAKTLPPQQPEREKDAIKLLIERTELHNFLSVPAPDILHKNAFRHDEKDKPVECNIYHPKYGYPGFETHTKEVVVTSFNPITVYQDESTGKYVHCRYYQQLVCTADEVNFSNKDGEKVIKVDYLQSNQTRLAENNQDFELIYQREFASKKLTDTPEIRTVFCKELITHIQELIELHEKRTSYKDGRDIKVLALANEFIDYLNRLIAETKTDISDTIKKPQSLIDVFPQMESKVIIVKEAIKDLNITSQLSERQLTGFVIGCKEAGALPQINDTDLLRVIFNEIEKPYKASNKPRYDQKPYKRFYDNTKKYFGTK